MSALLCKEQGITVLPVCIVYDILVASRVDTAGVIARIAGRKLFDDGSDKDDEDKEGSEAAPGEVMGWREVG